MTPARRFNLLVILSLVLFVVTLPGYVGRFGVLLSTVQPPAPPYPRQSWGVADGRFGVWTHRANPGQVGGYRMQWRGEFHRPRLDHQALDGFDAHPFPATTGGRGLAYLFSFPLWCVTLPSLAAPAWWLYRRRRRRSDPRLGPQGFPLAAGNASPKRDLATDEHR